MLLLGIIKQLQEEGFEIKYRKRSDGGYIITSINGVKYSGAKGNKIAREISGATISEARIKQLTFNVERYIKKHKKPKVDIPDDLVKELKRIQRLMRKTKSKGHITKRKLRAQYLEGGRRQAKKYLSQMEKYATGIAYEENVYALATRIRNDANYCQGYYAKVGNELRRIADYIIKNKDTFKEKWIPIVNSYLYQIEEGIVVGDDNEINSGILAIWDTIK